MRICLAGAWRGWSQRCRTTLLSVVFGSLTAIGVVTPCIGFELLRLGTTCGASHNLYWQFARVGVDETLLSEDYRRQAQEAIDSWNEAVSEFRFDRGSGGFCDIDDSITSLGFGLEGCSGESLGDALTMTRLRWDERTGEILDADIVFNPNASLLEDREIFRQVVMHELGHVIGLDHSDACDNSGDGTLMQSFLSPSAPRIRRPTADDIAGVQAIYRPCAGDCNGDRRVPINELVLGVNIALEKRPVSACPAFADSEGVVNVSQLVKGVNNTLHGCGSD